MSSGGRQGESGRGRFSGMGATLGCSDTDDRRGRGEGSRSVQEVWGGLLPPVMKGGKISLLVILLILYY